VQIQLFSVLGLPEWRVEVAKLLYHLLTCIHVLEMCMDGVAISIIIRFFCEFSLGSFKRVQMANQFLAPCVWPVDVVLVLSGLARTCLPPAKSSPHTVTIPLFP
jgi:hypothetical protein